MKLLMHMCCANCSLFPVSLLKKKEIEVDGLYYQKSIHDSDENEDHVNKIKEFAQKENINVYIYPEIEQKCLDQDTLCIEELRMKMTFELGKELGYDAITTSMLLSPSMNHERIMEFGLKFSEMYQLPFYYEGLNIDSQID